MKWPHAVSAARDREQVHIGGLYVPLCVRYCSRATGYVDRVNVLMLRGRVVKRRLTLLVLVNIAVVLLGCVPAVLTSGSSTSPGTGGVGSGGGTTGPVGWPTVREAVITRGYGCHQFWTGVHGPCGEAWWHDGTDFALASGPPLYAVVDMYIAYAGADSSTYSCAHMAGSQAPHNGFGNYVKGVDDDGRIYHYGHAAKVYVQAGDTVQAGEEIAQMGSTGCSTGNHLHLRVTGANGQTINPMDILTPP